MSLVFATATATTYQPCSPASVLLLTHCLGPGWGPYQWVHWAFPTTIALTPQPSGPHGLLLWLPSLSLTMTNLGTGEMTAVLIQGPRWRPGKQPLSPGPLITRAS